MPYDRDKKEIIDFHTLLIFTLWYEFSNNFETSSYFGKNFVTEKLVPWNHSYSKHALELHKFVTLTFTNIYASDFASRKFIHSILSMCL